MPPKPRAKVPNEPSSWASYGASDASQEASPNSNLEPGISDGNGPKKADKDKGKGKQTVAQAPMLTRKASRDQQASITTPSLQALPVPQTAPPKSKEKPKDKGKQRKAQSPPAPPTSSDEGSIEVLPEQIYKVTAPAPDDTSAFWGGMLPATSTAPRVDAGVSLQVEPARTDEINTPETFTVFSTELPPAGAQPPAPPSTPPGFVAGDKPPALPVFAASSSTTRDTPAGAQSSALPMPGGPPFDPLMNAQPQGPSPPRPADHSAPGVAPSPGRGPHLFQLGAPRTRVPSARPSPGRSTPRVPHTEGSSRPSSRTDDVPSRHCLGSPSGGTLSSRPFGRPALRLAPSPSPCECGWPHPSSPRTTRTTGPEVRAPPQVQRSPTLPVSGRVDTTHQG